MAKNGIKNEIIAITSLATGQSVKIASEKSGIPYRTLHRRWSDENFKREISEARRQLIESSLGKLVDSTGDAVDALRRLLKSNNENVRLNSCKIILGTMMQLRTQIEFDARISTLEVYLGDGDEFRNTVEKH